MLTNFLGLALGSGGWKTKFGAGLFLAGQVADMVYPETLGTSGVTASQICNAGAGLFIPVGIGDKIEKGSKLRYEQAENHRKVQEKYLQELRQMSK